MALASRHIALPALALLLAWQGRPARPPHGGIVNKYDACRLLDADDAAVILGAGATSFLSPGGQTCTWTSADKHRKLSVRTPESTRTKPEVTFEQYKTGPHHDFTIADEPEMGDHAVSAITPYGVEFMVLKQDRILFIQDGAAYGVKGTAEMLNTARPIAKKAFAAF
jgi:hypothetical protein